MHTIIDLTLYSDELFQLTRVETFLLCLENKNQHKLQTKSF